MNEIVSFGFDANTVRVIERDGEPWFVAKDVAAALGYTNPQKATRDHCKRAVSIGVNETVTPTQALDPQTIIIPEPDVYRLIMRSRLPSAERFETWVVEEVIPSTRRTGRYEAQGFQIPTTYAGALRLAAEQAEARERAEAELADARPKVAAHDDFIASDGLITIQEAASALGIKQLRLFERLREAHWLDRRTGVGNVPTRWAQERDFMRVRPVKTGPASIYMQPLLTPRGLAALRTQTRDGDLFLHIAPPRRRLLAHREGARA